MDIRSKNGCIRQTKNLNSEKRHLDVGSGSTKVSPRQVVITSPKPRSSIADRGHTPSSIPRIKSVPLFVPTRRSSIKTLKDRGRNIPSKISNFSSEDNSNSGISQPISAINRISTKSTRAMSNFTRNHKQLQAFPKLNVSINSPRLNSKKTRKPIDLNMFQPSSLQKITTRNCSDVNSDKSSNHSSKDRSEFSDWEFIDWPWVTPYAPLDRIVLLSDIYNLNIFDKSSPKHFFRFPTLGPNLSSYLFNSTSDGVKNTSIVPLRDHGSNNYKKTSDRCTSQTIQSFWNENILQAKPITCPSKSPSLQALLPIGESTPRNTMWDPAVISHGPLHHSQSENLIENSSQQQSSSNNFTCGELCTKTLQQCTRDILNCVSKMRKQDGVLLQEVLHAFLESKKNEKPCNDPHHESEEKTKVKGRRALNKHLNPDVPDFHPKTDNAIEGSTEVERFPLLQTTNLKRMFPKEISSRTQCKEGSGINILQAKPQVPFAKDKSNRVETKASQNHFREKASSDRSNDIDDILMETCMKKIQVLESEAQQHLGGGDGTFHNTCFPLKNFGSSTGSVSEMFHDIEVDDENIPGRVANAMEPSWAAQMLEKFRSKYPMTGTVKSSPIIDMKKKLFCDQQQRLEYLLLQRKENSIYQQQMYRITPSESSWNKFYNV